HCFARSPCGTESLVPYRSIALPARDPPPNSHERSRMSFDDHQPSLWGEGGPPGTETLPLPLPDPAQRITRVAGHPVRIGTSGFSLPDWEGAFYPRGLASGRRLEFYARYFPTVEINSTYYGIPEPRTFRLLLEKSPKDFDFVVKAHQSMTHEEVTEPSS